MMKAILKLSIIVLSVFPLSLFATEKGKIITKTTKKVEKPKVTAVNAKDIVPPVPIKVIPAKYPLNGYAKPPGVTVIVKIVISKNGKITNTKIVKSGGKLFDREAIKAVELWTFKPATYKGKPIEVRISVPFKFPSRIKPKKVVKKQLDTKNIPKNNTKTTKTVDNSLNKDKNVNQNIKKNHGIEKSNGEKADSEEEEEITVGNSNSSENNKTKKNDKNKSSANIIVKGKLKRPKVSGVGEFKISKAVLSVAPQPSAGDMLRTAPGFYVGHPQGEGVANALFLRGFNAQHGQDFELWAGEIPINLSGHIHAQGYADMHFIIPETIDSLKVIEGVFDSSQGDFAVAGSGYYKYGVRQRGVHMGLTYGSYNAMRLLLLWAPKGQGRETFMAASVRQGDGYGNGNRSYQNAAVVGRYALMLNPKTYAVFHLGSFGSRSVLPGVVRLDDIESGKVGFYDSYNDPTARSQSSFFTRFETSAKLERLLEKKGEKLHMTFWYLRTNWRLRQNFTGYLLSFPDQPELMGAGDLHQQVNLDESYGASFGYNSGKRKLFGFNNENRIGVSLRNGWIEQTEDLIYPAQNMIWRHTVDTGVRITDLGFYGDSKIKFSDMFRVKAGFRADYLIFQIDDRLGNWQYNTPSVQNNQLGYKRDAMGLSAGPRISMEIGPFYKYVTPNIFKGLSFITSYGEGFRSPPPRSLQEGEKTPFTKVRSLESGIKWYLTENRKIFLKIIGFYTYLSDDYIYDPTTAMARSIGDTSRLGAMGYISAKPIKGLIITGSLTYAYSVLEGSPLPTPADPQPGQKKGDLIPYIPPWVGRVDAGWSKKVMKIRGYSVKLRAGVGYSYIGARPIPYSQWAEPVHLADLTLGAIYRNYEFKIETSNIFDTRWHDTEFNFVSQWDPSNPTRIPQRHVVAGSPRTIMATFKVNF